MNKCLFFGVYFQKTLQRYNFFLTYANNSAILADFLSKARVLNEF